MHFIFDNVRLWFWGDRRWVSANFLYDLHSAPHYDNRYRKIPIKSSKSQNYARVRIFIRADVLTWQKWLEARHVWWKHLHFKCIKSAKICIGTRNRKINIHIQSIWIAKTFIWNKIVFLGSHFSRYFFFETRVSCTHLYYLRARFKNIPVFFFLTKAKSIGFLLFVKTSDQRGNGSVLCMQHREMRKIHNSLNFYFDRKFMEMLVTSNEVRAFGCIP